MEDFYFVYKKAIDFLIWHQLMWELKWSDKLIWYPWTWSQFVVIGHCCSLINPNFCDWCYWLVWLSNKWNICMKSLWIFLIMLLVDLELFCFGTYYNFFLHHNVLIFDELIYNQVSLLYMKYWWLEIVYFLVYIYWCLCNLIFVYIEIVLM